MKASEFIQEDTGSGDIATVATNLFARPIKRIDNRTYSNTPKMAKYEHKTKDQKNATGTSNSTSNYR